MGWETRGKHQYYYRACRIDGKPRRVYLGGGAVGRFHASLDADQQEQAQAERDRVRARRDAERLLRDGVDLSRALVAATLTVEGWYYHHGEWRRAVRPPMNRRRQPLPKVPFDPLADRLRALATRVQRGDVGARKHLRRLLDDADELHGTACHLVEELDAALDRSGAENGLPAPPPDRGDIAGGLIGALIVAAEIMVRMAQQPRQDSSAPTISTKRAATLAGRAKVLRRQRALLMRVRIPAPECLRPLPFHRW